MGKAGCEAKTQIDTLHITSYNIQNFHANKVCLLELLEKNHIICLQEHWLFEFESSILTEVSEKHNVISKSVDIDDPISPNQRPRGYGGVAVFLSKLLHNRVKVHNEGDHRVIVITLTTDSDKICLINVYMPCRGYSSSLQDYEDVLAQLCEIINKFGSEHEIIITGDLNACPNGSPKSSHDRSLQRFCKEHKLVLPHDYNHGSTFEHAGGR